MNGLADAWPWLMTMGILILLSALFSGSEAALFSLRDRDRRRLSRSGTGGRIAAKLLGDPERLLSAILFWNLLINMTYFAIAAIVGGRLEADTSTGASQAIVFTALSLLTIIFFSEMLPKSIAVISPLRLSMLVGFPLAIAIRIVDPILPLIKLSNQAAGRLIWPTFQPEPDINLDDIERAIELGTDDAALLQRERRALRGIVELADTRVDELMRTRSRLPICELPVDRDVLMKEVPPGGYLLICEAGDDTIVAALPLRQLRPSQMDDLKGAMEPVVYVPWSALVSQVLDQLNDEDRSVAVVVNEFGETIGALSVDEILYAVLAPRDGQDDAEDAVRQLGPWHYRMNGSASLRVLVKRLELEAPEERIATVAGYIQRHNERLPRVGDTAPLDRFTLAVVEESDEGITIEAFETTTETADEPEQQS